MMTQLEKTFEEIECDVLIIGASISGNLLATYISNLDLDVHVLEEHKRIGKPMECAGIVSSKILTIMHVPTSCIMNQVSEAKIRIKGQQPLFIHTKDNPIVLDRVELDNYYAKIAQERGVKYHLQERAMRISRADGSYTITTSNGRMFKPKLLVGCDGMGSIVAKYFGITHGFITGKQLIFQVVDGDILALPETNQCELFFDQKWNDLFGWVIPTSEEKTFRVGLATRKKVSKRFELFMRSRFGKRLGKFIKNGKVRIIRTTGGTVPIGLPNNCAFDRCLVIGDAACQVKASTAGGIVMLAIATKHAARAVRASFSKRNFSKEFLRKWYQKPFFKETLLTLRIHLVVHEALKRMGLQDYKLLFSLGRDPRIKKALERMGDMDFPLPFLIRMLGMPRFYRWVVQFLTRDAFLVRFLQILLTKPRGTN